MNRLFSNKKINKVREDINGYCSTCDRACMSNCISSVAGLTVNSSNTCNWEDQHTN